MLRVQRNRRWSTAYASPTLAADGHAQRPAAVTTVQSASRDAGAIGLDSRRLLISCTRKATVLVVTLDTVRFPPAENRVSLCILRRSIL
jgi:hypothetical protein